MQGHETARLKDMKVQSLLTKTNRHIYSLNWRERLDIFEPARNQSEIHFTAGKVNINLNKNAMQSG